MKKILCTLLVVCLVAALACFALAACSKSAMKQAIKNGDNYTIVAAYDDENHVLSATQTVEMINRSENSFTAVKFHIYANQYREDAANGVVSQTYYAQAYPNGNSYGDIAFDSVKVNGTAVAYTIEGQDMDVLSVPVDELFPNQKVSIEMTYEVTLANMAHRLGYTDQTVNLGNFYPILCHVDNGSYTTSPYYAVGDPFVTDVANYNVSLTLPESYVVASSGNLNEATSQNGLATYTYTADAVRDFAMVLSTQFKKLTRTVGNTQVNYYYYNDADAETSLATACGMMEYLNEHVGAYPYAQYSVAETEFCYGGMEYPSLAMVTSRSQSYQEAVAHETAHQWFYGIVGNDQYDEAFLDEAFAFYAQVVYMQFIDGKSKPELNDIVRVRYDSLPVDLSLDEYKAIMGADYLDSYTIAVYRSGRAFLWELQKLMGDNRFFELIRQWVAAQAFKTPTIDDFLDHLYNFTRNAPGVKAIVAQYMRRAQP